MIQLRNNSVSVAHAGELSSDILGPLDTMSQPQLDDQLIALRTAGQLWHQILVVHNEFFEFAAADDFAHVEELGSHDNQEGAVADLLLRPFAELLMVGGEEGVVVHD